MSNTSEIKYKEILKRIIIQNQDRLKNLDIIERAIDLERYGNYVFVGLRRVGKTYILYQIIKSQYQTEDVLFINFEDERLIGLTHNEFNVILDAYSELYPNKEKPIIFLDEIHNVNHWDKFVRRLADNDYRVMVTGSNSKMLSSDISTVLGGRFFNKTIYPLTFTEYLKFQKISLNSNFEYSKQLTEVKKAYSDYLQYGGLPELFKYKNKREYLSGIYQKLFFGDVIARYNIANTKALQLLIKKIAESINNETSINRIKNIIKSSGIPTGNNTLFEYIEFLKESFLVYSISNYANKIVERETKRKYYFADTGLLGLFLIDQDTKLLENLVFVELSRRYSEQIFYFKRKLEVDFYLPSEKLLIQVSYSIHDEETRKREVKALTKAMDELHIQSGTIITYDTEDLIQLNNKIINVIPAWKWLLT
jgi:predicted AAA+ superfamily ATPase